MGLLEVILKVESGSEIQSINEMKEKLYEAVWDLGDHELRPNTFEKSPPQ